MTQESLWETRYAELVQWVDENHTCMVPKNEGRLGRWVARQRELRRGGKLSEERIHKLDAIGFTWSSNKLPWSKRFEMLQAWYRRNGHCCVPIADGELGMWVAKQRQLYRVGKMPSEREKRLGSLGFVWNTADSDWMAKFQSLKQWKDEHGHCCVPFNEGELGWWTNTQRQAKRKGKLRPEREALLQDLDFVWNAQDFDGRKRRREEEAAVPNSSSESGVSSSHNSVKTPKTVSAEPGGSPGLSISNHLELSLSPVSIARGSGKLFPRTSCSALASPQELSLELSNYGADSPTFLVGDSNDKCLPPISDLCRLVASTPRPGPERRSVIPAQFLSNY